MLGRKLFQTNDLHSRKQGRIYFKERVFRGSTYQNDGTVFNIGKQYILLCFVEAMNFVDKDDGSAHTAPLQFLSFTDKLAQFRHAGRNSVNGNKLVTSHISNDSSKSCLACSRRSVKQNGLKHITLNHATQRTTCPHCTLLSNEVA